MTCNERFEDDLRMWFVWDAIGQLEMSSEVFALVRELCRRRMRKSQPRWLVKREHATAERGRLIGSSSLDLLQTRSWCSECDVSAILVPRTRESSCSTYYARYFCKLGSPGTACNKLRKSIDVSVTRLKVQSNVAQGRSNLGSHKPHSIFCCW